MADINKTNNQQADLAKLYDRYAAGGKTQYLGVEIEQWFVNRQTPVKMMTPEQSQSILTALAATPDAKIFIEENGVKKQSPLDAANKYPIVMVDLGDMNFQLELCGVLEAATAPVPADDPSSLLALVDKAQERMRSAAAAQNLIAYPCAVPASITVEDCAKNMVNRERLRAEWAKFSAIGKDNPGLRTMGLATSVQVSIGYRSADDLKEIIMLGNYLSPLLTAVFSNTTGFIEGKKSDQMPRPAWWLEHNKFAPRGGIPSQIARAMQDKDSDIVTAWFDYVTNVPMVYYFDKNGNAAFDRSPTFRELQNEGNGTAANFFLAESLTWPDVKLIGGQRVELRMCDAGPWQAQALALIAYGLFTDRETRAKTMELLQSTGISVDGLINARQDICTQGMDTIFGNTTLRKIAPAVMNLALEKCRAAGIDEQRLRDISRLSKNPTADSEGLKKTFNKKASAADIDKALILRTARKHGL